MNDHGTTHLGTQPGAFADVLMSGVNYRYGPEARMIVDADFRHGRSDTLRLEGSSWSSLEANPRPLRIVLRTDALVPKATLRFMHHSADTTYNAAMPIEIEDRSLLFSYTVERLLTGDGADFGVTAKANFAPSEVVLNTRQSQAAKGLQGLWDRFESGAANDVQLMNIFTGLYDQVAQGYTGVLDTIASEIVGVSAAASPAMATSFIGTTQSCPGFVGDGTLLAEGECAWGRVSGSIHDRSPNSEDAGYRGDTVAIQGGGQKRLADGWFLGGAIGLEQGWVESSNGRERSDGNSFMAGVALKRQQGPWLLSAALGFGYGWGDSTRQVVLPRWSAVASASPRSDFQAGRLRASDEIPMQRWYLRPILDLDVIRVHQADYSESGAGALNLMIEDQSKVFFAATPAIEVGGRFEVNEHLIARPYLTLGLSLLSDDTWATEARLQGQDNTNSPDMTFATPIPDILARVSLGVDLLRKDGSEKRWEAKLQYDGEFGDDYSSNGGILRIGYRF